MPQRAYLSTRKGLFELERNSAGWAIGASHFLGEPVSFAPADRRRCTRCASAEAISGDG